MSILAGLGAGITISLKPHFALMIAAVLSAICYFGYGFMATMSMLSLGGFILWLSFVACVLGAMFFVFVAISANGDRRVAKSQLEQLRK